jgi:hypothetical protein
MEVSSSRLTHGLSTPSLKGTGPEPKFWLALWARTPQIWVLILVSYNSAKKGWSGQLGPRYIHIVISHWWSGWTQQMTKVHGRSAPINPPHSSCWTTSHRDCSLWTSFWATPYPHLGWGTGQLPVNTRSGVLVSFLKNNHTFRHPTEGLDIERRK